MRFMRPTTQLGRRGAVLILIAAWRVPHCYETVWRSGDLFVWVLSCRRLDFDFVLLGYAAVSGIGSCDYLGVKFAFSELIENCTC